MLQLSASVTSIDGKKRIFLQKKFETDSAESAVDELYRELLLKGADKILEEVSSLKKTITS